MLSYLASSISSGDKSIAFDSLRFRLNFLLRAEVEKTDSVSEAFSTGLGAISAFGVMEKLGALGPFGRG